MNRILVLLVTFFVIQNSVLTNPYSNISVRINNHNPNIPFIINDGITNDTLKIINGFVETKIQLTSPAFMIIIYERLRKTVYLAPNVSLSMSFDYKSIDSTFKYGGNGATINNFLDSFYRHNIKTIDFGRIINSSFDKVTIDYIDSSYNCLINKFRSLTKLRTLDSEFVEYACKNMEFEMKGLKFGNCSIIADSSCHKMLEDIKNENDKYLNIPSFRYYLGTLLNCSVIKLLTKSNTSYSFYDFVDLELKMTESIKQPKIKEYLVFNSIYYLLFNMGTKDFDKYYLYFNTHNTDSTYSNLLKLAYNNKVQSSNKQIKLSFSDGEPAPNFTCFDKEINQVSLSDFKGKNVYIDFWATWCKPCKVELPYYVKLQADYKDKDILFVSISLDENKESWMKSLNESKSEITNLIADNGMASDIVMKYQINGIPRFVLIDAYGRLVKIDAPRPSSVEIREILDKILEQQ